MATIPDRYLVRLSPDLINELATRVRTRRQLATVIRRDLLRYYTLLAVEHAAVAERLTEDDWRLLLAVFGSKHPPEDDISWYLLYAELLDAMMNPTLGLRPRTPEDEPTLRELLAKLGSFCPGQLAAVADLLERWVLELRGGSIGGRSGGGGGDSATADGR